MFGGFDLKNSLPKCKGNGEELGEELVICNSCSIIITKDSCKKLGNVISTTLVDGSKIVFNVQPAPIATASELAEVC